jgi:molecular chaperone GrpE
MIKSNREQKKDTNSIIKKKREVNKNKKNLKKSSVKQENTRMDLSNLFKEEKEKKVFKKFLDGKFNKLESELQLVRERYLRSLANLENYKKRVSREQKEMKVEIMLNLASQILPIFDSVKIGFKIFKRYCDNKKNLKIKKKIMPIFKGFKIAIDQIKNFLLDQNIEEINPINKVFDPNFHECISTAYSEESKSDNNNSSKSDKNLIITKVVRTGFVFKKSKLIRAAMVTVGK